MSTGLAGVRPVVDQILEDLAGAGDGGPVQAPAPRAQPDQDGPSVVGVGGPQD